jgi:hypothetical protein
VQELGVIYVDTPNGEAAKTSSSYNLSIFSSGAECQCAKVSSPSIGELWLDIDKLDEVNREGASAAHNSGVVSHDKALLTLVEKTCTRSKRRRKIALLSDAPEPCKVKCKGHRKNSSKKKAA